MLEINGKGDEGLQGIDSFFSLVLGAAYGDVFTLSKLMGSYPMTGALFCRCASLQSNVYSKENCGSHFAHNHYEVGCLMND